MRLPGAQGSGFYSRRGPTPPPHSNHHFKQLTREVNAALPGVGALKPLKWVGVPITFNVVDHPISAKGVGLVPLVVSPTIFNLKVTKTLVDGGAGLKVLSPETFEKMHIPFEHLMPMKPFSGVTSGSTTPLG